MAKDTPPARFLVAKTQERVGDENGIPTSPAGSRMRMTDQPRIFIQNMGTIRPEVDDGIHF
jgi:hypothetical protein